MNILMQVMNVIQVMIKKPALNVVLIVLDFPTIGIRIITFKLTQPVRRRDQMTQAEERIMLIIADGQDKDYKPFIRSFTGRVTQVVELKNPLPASMLVDDIDRIFDIMNPELHREITWLKELQEALKAWVNEKVTTNRLLGITNDNEYDVTVFEKIVMERFELSTKPKEMKFEVSFSTLVKLVEEGARQFSH